MGSGMEKIGLTTTVPVELVFAAGYQPVDVNNIFISDPEAMRRVEAAERAGYPRTVCGWIKGLYATIVDTPDIRKVIAVTQGDCSNTQALMETLEAEGIEVIPFAYPYDRDYGTLQREIEKLAQRLGADWAEAGRQKQRLDAVRRLAWKIDEASWQNGAATGFENHLYQVGCSDFEGDPEGYAEKLSAFLREVQAREKEVRPAAASREVRLAFIGVPPIFPDLYDFLEEAGARVVFNEVQRQFTLPFPGADLVESYRLYTYPYSIFWRLQDIEREVRRRDIDGIVHYTQSFCYRQIEDILIRRQRFTGRDGRSGVPILTIQGENPVGLDARTRLRLESFIDIVRERQ